MLIAIPTRNNPQGLASLLTQLIRIKNRIRQVVISDGSNIPVVCDSYIARLIACLPVTYRHTVEPHLVRQRMACVHDIVSAETPVVWCDDDVIPMGDWWSALAEDMTYHQDMFIQGTKVDLLNDRGYPDFGEWSKTPNAHKCWHEDHEVDHSGKTFSEVGYHPDSGLFCTTAFNYLYLANEVISVSKEDTPAAVMDDAIAEFARRKSRYLLHSDFWGYHVGNSNNHWSHAAHKREAVNRLLGD